VRLRRHGNVIIILLRHGWWSGERFCFSNQLVGEILCRPIVYCTTPSSLMPASYSFLSNATHATNARQILWVELSRRRRCELVLKADLSLRFGRCVLASAAFAALVWLRVFFITSASAALKNARGPCVACVALDEDYRPYFITLPA